MPTNLLLLPFLGGYWFLHVFHYSRIRSRRLDGYRLLAESALMGLLLALVARAVVVSSQLLVPAAKHTWIQFAPNVEYLGTAVVAALLGCLLPYPINWILRWRGRLEDLQYHAIVLHGNLLLRLLHRASRERRLVSITLDNLKVYVGWVTEAPNLEPHETFVEIRPALSGYRVRETLELRLPINYVGVDDDDDSPSPDIRLAIPLSSIRMAAFFDQTLYAAFQAQSEPSAAADSSAPPIS